MSRLSYLLLHAGEDDPESRQVLDIVTKSGLADIIVPIHVNDEATKNWIQHNTMGVVVTELPAITIAQEGQRTQVYPGKAINTIIDQVRTLIMS